MIGDNLMNKSENRVTYLPDVAGKDMQMEAINTSGMEIADVFAGADIGLALFDSGLSLLACNALYRSLCGYQASEASSGRNLRELIRISYNRMNVPEAEITNKIERIVTALVPGTAYTFRYSAPSGSVVEVRRRRFGVLRVPDSEASLVDVDRRFLWKRAHESQ